MKINIKTNGFSEMWSYVTWVSGGDVPRRHMKHRCWYDQKDVYLVYVVNITQQN